MKPVQQNHSTIYKSRSLSACFTRVPLVHSLSAHGWSQIWPDNLDWGRGVGASFTLSSAAREETNGCRASRLVAMSFSPRERRLGRASDPFFLPAVLWPRCGLPTPSLPHADDPQVYIPSKPALLYCPSSSPFVWILFYFRPLFQSHLDFYYY